MSFIRCLKLSLRIRSNSSALLISCTCTSREINRSYSHNSQQTQYIRNIWPISKSVEINARLLLVASNPVPTARNVSHIQRSRCHLRWILHFMAGRYCGFIVCATAPFASSSACFYRSRKLKYNPLHFPPELYYRSCSYHGLLFQSSLFRCISRDTPCDC